MLPQRRGYRECLWARAAKTNFGTKIPSDEAPGKSERTAKCIGGNFVHVERIEITFFTCPLVLRHRWFSMRSSRSVNSTTTLWNADKNWLRWWKRRISRWMRVWMDWENDDRPRTKTIWWNDRPVGIPYSHVNINITRHLVQSISRSSAHTKWTTV